MNIQTTIPESKVLQEYIECYYVLENGVGEESNYLTFPTTNTIMTISRQSSVCIDGNQISITHDPMASTSVNIVPPFSEALQINYSGYTREITIYFKPLGFQQFDFEYVDFGQIPIDIELIENLDICRLNEMLSTTDHCKLIETYLLELLDRKDLGIVHKAIDLIHDNVDIQVNDIASTFDVSRKTIHQYFKKHLGISPKTYINIHRFRRSIGKRSVRLSDLCHEMHYFDQAHMIKAFKQYTGFTPREFFTSITDENQKNVWIHL